MSPATPLRIASRANPLWVRLRKLAQDGTRYRKTGDIWLEGEHLCRAATARGRPVTQAVLEGLATPMELVVLVRLVETPRLVDLMAPLLAKLTRRWACV